MYPQDNDDDDLAGFEAALKSLHPRAPSPDFVDRATVEPVLRSVTPGAPSADFADRVVTEGRLREVTPREPSAGFADRVVAASVSVPSARILRFPGAFVPLAAAAALALAFAPLLTRERSGAPSPDVVEVAATHSAPATTVVAEAAPEFPEEALHLPVITLPDGSAYRPVLRRQASAPDDFRAMPGGAVMPVSFTPAAGVSYEPVVFE